MIGSWNPISQRPLLVKRTRRMQRSDLIRTILLVIALTLLVVGGAFAFGAFRGLSGHGMGALIAGIAISFAVGIGLFALMYVSNREHDEKAHFAARENFRTGSGTSDSAKDKTQGPNT
jgi:hypothetical protein